MKSGFSNNTIIVFNNVINSRKYDNEVPIIKLLIAPLAGWRHGERSGSNESISQSVGHSTDNRVSATFNFRWFVGLLV